MSLNWLDFLILIVLIVSIGNGIAQGMVRLLFGIAGAICGIVFGLWFYGIAGAYLEPVFKTEALANLMGFILIFCAFVGIGGLLSWLIRNLLKKTGLSWADRMLGAGAGALQGLLVLTALILAFMAFPVRPVSKAISESTLSPYVVGLAGVVSAAAPTELKDGFRAWYEEVRRLWDDALHKKAQRLPAESL